MNRHYLLEDIQQIQKYFPGAEAVPLEVPFVFSNKPRCVTLHSLNTDDSVEYFYGEGVTI